MVGASEGGGSAVCNSRYDACFGRNNRRGCLAGKPGFSQQAGVYPASRAFVDYMRETNREGVA